MLINGKTHGNVAKSDLPKILGEYTKEEALKNG
jgi:hypothetical protein